MTQIGFRHMGYRWIGLLAGAGLALGCPSDGGADGDDSSTGSPSTDTQAMTTQGTTGQDADSTDNGETGPDATSSGTGGTGLDDTTGSGSGDTSGSTGSESGTSGVESCTVVIAELVVDPEGDDDEFQWVKLKNLCDEDIDLQTWTLGWAGIHYGDDRNKQLRPLKDVPGFTTTVIPAGGCYLVGGPQTGLTNGDPIFDYPDDFAPGFTFAQAAGSGVALFDAPKAEVDETTTPVDAVIYGANNDNNLIDQTGEVVAEPHVGLHAEGGSISRTTAEGDWVINAVPQAADCPDF